MTTQALAPSENWLALPAVTGLQGGETFECRIGSVAVITICHDLLVGHLFGFPIDFLPGCLERHDFIGEQSCLLRSCRALLA
jgi:hypothetical protein